MMQEREVGLVRQSIALEQQEHNIYRNIKLDVVPESTSTVQGKWVSVVLEIPL